MNVFNKVTLQSLKKNKTRTIVTIIGIILSAAMICAVTTFASSFMNYAKETTIYTDGNWHAYKKNTSYKTYEDICTTGKVEEAVYLQQIGNAYAEGCENEFKPYIYVLGAGKDVEEVLPIHITSGKYPTSSTEIMLPEHLYANGGEKYNLGETITLDLGQRVLDGYPMEQGTPCYIYEQGQEVFNGETLEIKEARTYTVVGFYERLSWRLEDFESPGYTAITLADKDINAEYDYDVYFRMKNPKDTFDFMKEMKIEGEYNQDLLMYSGTFAANSFTTMLYSLAAIVIALIMFGSVSLIYNAFSISVSERTKQFGLLSSIGATKKQLKKMVFFEALSVSAIGVPLGILAGVGGIGVTLMFVGDKFRSIGFPFDMKLSVSTAAIIIAVIVALITVLISAWIPSKRATKISAVEAIRQNMDVKNTKPVKTSKLTYKLFGLPGMLANKHYKRNKKKYRTTVLSLFMSIVLFVSASAFTDYLMETVGVGFGSVGYDLSMHASGSEFDKITPEELMNRMKAAKSVTGGAYSQERNVEAEISTKYLTEEGIEFLDKNQGKSEDKSARNVYSHISFVDDTTFRALLKENGLSEQKYMDPENPLAIAVDGATMFNLYTQKYETTTFFENDEFELIVQKEKDIPGYYCSGEVPDENGNIRVLYLKDSESDVEGPEELYFPLEEGYVYTTLNVGEVIYEKPFFVRDSSGMRYIYPLSLAESVFEDFQAIDNSYYYMLRSDSHAESYTAVQSILNDNGFNAKNLQNIAEMEESERNIVTIIRVFSYGFIVLISLIAAANVFNTISTNISLRRREFAMLKSVGMTQKAFNKMMNFECLLYGSRALLYGLPVSCGVTYLIYLAIMEGYEAKFHLPWTAIGIAVLSVFLVVFITMMYSMSKIKKDNPIDALKNENL
uniref:ABC transporter permease n=1 Tax=Agathobacter sp. TaxID=2021311 RepID=UPI004055FC38